jgi:hypothetical protein
MDASRRTSGGSCRRSTPCASSSRSRNRQTEAERARVDQLLIDLADARTAAMITGCEAAALRSRLALLTDHRPWWRRWFR